MVLGIATLAIIVTFALAVVGKIGHKRKAQKEARMDKQQDADDDRRREEKELEEKIITVILPAINSDQ